MAKELDLSKSVYELVEMYPELKDTLYKLGFKEITKPGMLQSVGRIMTIPKGATQQGISMGKVVMTLMAKGYRLTGEMPDISVNLDHREEDSETEQKDRNGNDNGVSDQEQEDSEVKARRELLKSYLARLSAGEDLEAVRADFAGHFADVDALEIMQAEQEMMEEGTPLEEVQQLCDVHSALFHGATREEQIANAEAAAQESLKKSQKEAARDNEEKRRAAAENSAKKAGKVNLKAAFAAAFGKKKEESAADTKAAEAALTEAQKAVAEQTASMSHEDFEAKREEKLAKGQKLAEIPGHPIHTFSRENKELQKLLDQVNAMPDDRMQENGLRELLQRIREISIHYAKKGDLLYPHMEAKYNISGPSNVMWTVDDEIRDEMASLEKEEHVNAGYIARVRAVVKRMEEMIYKEENILFPICAEHFTEEEWFAIYEDAKDYAVCLGIDDTVWPEAEEAIASGLLEKQQKGRVSEEDAASGEIVMPGGHMNIEQLTALLNTIPLEITFVDADDINRFFNEGPKVFKRAGMAIDRNVYSCHPPKIEPMVRAIIEDFRYDRRDSVPVWMEKGGKTMLVTYMAVRNKKREYLGTVEVIQDMEEIKAHFAKLWGVEL